MHPGHNAVLHKHEYTQKRIEKTASEIAFHREKIITQIMLDSCARIYH
jgi:hypothetical protein